MSILDKIDMETINRIMLIRPKNMTPDELKIYKAIKAKEWKQRKLTNKELTKKIDFPKYMNIPKKINSELLIKKNILIELDSQVYIGIIQEIKNNKALVFIPSLNVDVEISIQQAYISVNLATILKG